MCIVEKVLGIAKEETIPEWFDDQIVENPHIMVEPKDFFKDDKLLKSIASNEYRLVSRRDWEKYVEYPAMKYSKDNNPFPELDWYPNDIMYDGWKIDLSTAMVSI